MATSSQSPDTMEKEDINILLLGKTGVGKSSTGNAILGRECFETSPDAIRKTSWIQQEGEYTKYKEYNIKVIDTPGFCDNVVGTVSSNILIHEGIIKALYMCPGGFNALVVVNMYGSRFVGEEKNTVATLKHIFGDSFAMKHCILIFTHGELLDIENRRKTNPETFETWLKRQKGDLEKLIKECGFERCLLFRNGDEDFFDKQREDLFGKITSLERYTNDIFRRVGARREAFIMQQKSLLLQGHVHRSYSFLEDSVKNVINVLGKKQAATDKRISEALDTLYNDAKTAEKAIEDIDKELKVLSQMHMAIKGVISDTGKFKDALTAGLFDKAKAREELETRKARLKASKNHCLQGTAIHKTDSNRVVRETLNIVIKAMGKK